jgi:hypothetical protein
LSEPVAHASVEQESESRATCPAFLFYIRDLSEIHGALIQIAHVVARDAHGVLTVKFSPYGPRCWQWFGSLHDRREARRANTDEGRPVEDERVDRLSEPYPGALLGDVLGQDFKEQHKLHDILSNVIKAAQVAR